MPLDTKVRSEDLFSRLQPEDEFQDRMLETNLGLPEIVQTPDLEKIVRGFRRMEKFFRKFPQMVSIGDSRDYEAGHVRDSYMIACTLSPLQDISSQDIASFSILSSNKGFNRKHLGFYLSALINKCPEEKIKLYLTNPKKPIDYLLLRAREKDITVIGDAGNICGAHLYNCRVEIHGNTGDYLCDNANESKVLISGNTGKEIGDHAHKSRIVIFGNYKSISAYTYADIYLRGKLIVENGRRV